jgi:ferric-dicitrate binding protein FerR (iron transport regulator)
MLFVPKGYIYKLILPDSTVVELNADSWICIPADYGCLKRELFFEGEAFFDIAPDARRLLTIHSGPVDVLALGTSVNINNYDGNNIQVALVEGSVIVSTTDRKKQLKAGEAATIEKHTSLMAIDTFSLTHTLGWRQGRYDAQGKTMKEIAAVMERWYNIKVVFDNPDLANQVLSGALFRNQPPEKYLKNFKDLGFLDYYMDDESTLHLK